MINRIFSVSVIAGICGICSAQVMTSELKSITTTPTAEQAQQIDEYVKSYADKLIASQNNAGEVMTLRATMIDQTDKGQDAFYSALAASVQKNFADTVFADDARAIVKVNAAMIAASIESPSAAKLFASMVSSNNPAVRYYGWKGFSAVQDKIIVEGGNNLDTMLNAIKNIGTGESNLMVVTQMAKACKFEVDEDVTRSNAEKIRTSVKDTLGAKLTANMKMIRTGNTAACDAAAAMMESMSSVFRSASAEEKRPVLQIIANVIANAAAAYKDGGKLSSDKILVPHSSIAIAITEGEQAVNDIAGINSLAITRQVAQLIKSPTASGFGDMQKRVDELIGGNGTSGILARMNVSPPTIEKID